MELTITNRSTACPLSEGGTHEVGGFLVTSKYSHSIGYEGGTHEVGGFLVTADFRVRFGVFCSVFCFRGIGGAAA